MTCNAFQILAAAYRIIQDSLLMISVMLRASPNWEDSPNVSKKRKTLKKKTWIETTQITTTQILRLVSGHSFEMGGIMQLFL